MSKESLNSTEVKSNTSTRFRDHLIYVTSTANDRKATDKAKDIYEAMKNLMIKEAENGLTEYVFKYDLFPELYGHETYTNALITKVTELAEKDGLTLEYTEFSRDTYYYTINLNKR